MTKFESIICQMAEEKTSGEIYALISELQMIAEQKERDEEKQEIFPGVMETLNKLSIYTPTL